MKKTPQLNSKEVAVLRACLEGSTLADMAKRFRRNTDSVAQSNSWARNSVRKPLRMGLLEHVGPGNYRTTALGRALLDLQSKPQLVTAGRIGPKSAGSKVAADKGRRTA